MAIKINADTTSGLQLESDTSGAIDIQSAGVTKASIDTVGNLDIQGRYSGNGNVPSFSVEIGSDQTGISDATDTKVNFDSVETQLGVTFDTTNKRFTVPSGAGGLYYFSSTVQVRSETNSDLVSINLYLYKNGVKNQTNPWNFSTGYPRLFNMNLSKVLSLSEGDYIEIYAYLNTAGAGSTRSFKAGGSNFSGFKLIT